MKNKIVIDALLLLRQMNETNRQLSKLGIELTTYENSNNLLEKSVVLLIVTNEDNFKKALDDVLWWLYETTPKILTYQDGSKLDLTTPQSFVRWLEVTYN